MRLGLITSMTFLGALAHASHQRHGHNFLSIGPTFDLHPQLTYNSSEFKRRSIDIYDTCTQVLVCISQNSKRSILQICITVLDQSATEIDTSSFSELSLCPEDKFVSTHSLNIWISNQVNGGKEHDLFMNCFNLSPIGHIRQFHHQYWLANVT